MVPNSLLALRGTAQAPAWWFPPLLIQSWMDTLFIERNRVDRETVELRNPT